MKKWRVGEPSVGDRRAQPYPLQVYATMCASVDATGVGSIVLWVFGVFFNDQTFSITVCGMLLHEHTLRYALMF